MELLHRFCWSAHLHQPTEIDMNKAMRLFNDWIKQQCLPGPLMDAADYAHVGQGPLLVLVGHQGNYSLDQGHAALHLSYQHKTGLEQLALPERLRQGLNHWAQAAMRMDILPDYQVDMSTLYLQSNDRLHAPNTDAAADQLMAVLGDGLQTLHAKAPFSIERLANDPRERLSLAVHFQQAPSLITLLGGLR